MVTAYHYHVAVGHYQRLLAVKQRPPYAPIVVLLVLWGHAPDPYAESVVIDVASTRAIGTLLPSQRAVSNAITALVKVGAVTRLSGAYMLTKPKADDLDAIARQQLESLPLKLGGTESSALLRRLPAEREAIAAARHERVRTKRQTEALRKETIERIGKQRSHIRDMLAWLVNKKRNDLRYSGRGSTPVNLVIDWFASTGSEWQDFSNTCRAAKIDKDPNKPDDMLYLFDPKHDGYREGLLDRVRAQVAAAKAEGGNA